MQLTIPIAPTKYEFQLLALIAYNTRNATEKNQWRFFILSILPSKSISIYSFTNSRPFSSSILVYFFMLRSTIKMIKETISAYTQNGLSASRHEAMP